MELSKVVWAIIALFSLVYSGLLLSQIFNPALPASQKNQAGVKFAFAFLLGIFAEFVKVAGWFV